MPTERTTPTTISTKTASLIALDLNGDGKTDFIQIPVNTIPVVSSYISNGDGTFKAASFNPNCNSCTAARMVVADVNGDGKSDVIYALVPSDPVNSTVTLNTLISNGDGTFRSVGFNCPNCIYNSGEQNIGPQLQAVDLNGDGKTDLMFVPGYDPTPAGSNDGKPFAVMSLEHASSGPNDPWKYKVGTTSVLERCQGTTSSPARDRMDQRAVRGRRVARIADPDLGNARVEALQERIEDRPRNEQARPREAHLAGVVVLVRGGGRGGVEVGVVEHDERRLAAQLE